MPLSAAPPDAAELIDRLYAALFNEAPWEGLVERACDLMPNGKAVLFFEDKDSGSGAMSLSAGLDDTIVRKFSEYYHKINPWIDHAMERPLGKVMQADEMLPREILKRSEFYQDYLRPQDIETGLGVTLHREAGLHVFFSIVCADVTHERLEQARRSLTCLVPHLYRAFRVERESSELHPLGRSTAVLQIDSRLRVLKANAEALKLLAQSAALSIGPQSRLICKDPDFLSLLQHVLGSDRLPSVYRVPVKRRESGLPLQATIYRSTHPHAITGESLSCLIRLEDPSLALPNGVRRFASLHGLSVAETDIVAGLAAGLTLSEVALRRKTSFETVRTQLKAVFWKTGCKRQAEIVWQVACLAQGPDHTIPRQILIPQQHSSSEGCRGSLPKGETR